MNPSSDLIPNEKTKEADQKGPKETDMLDNPDKDKIMDEPTEVRETESERDEFAQDQLTQRGRRRGRGTPYYTSQKYDPAQKYDREYRDFQLRGNQRGRRSQGYRRGRGRGWGNMYDMSQDVRGYDPHLEEFQDTRGGLGLKRYRPPSSESPTRHPPPQPQHSTPSPTSDRIVCATKDKDINESVLGQALIQQTTT